MYVLKKTIGSLLMPMPVFLILLALGLWLFWRKQRRRAVQAMVSALAWITLLSYAPFSSLLLSPLESQYPRWTPDDSTVRYILVLGSGHDDDARLPLSSWPHGIGLARIVEGVHVYRSSPGAKLVFSGARGNTRFSDARANAEVAISLGVEPNDIFLLETSKDTVEEARDAKALIGERGSVVLVTSAAHMPRAMALFHDAGIFPKAAPTDFEAKSGQLNQWPCSVGMRLSERAFHEYLGLLWMQLKRLL